MRNTIPSLDKVMTTKDLFGLSFGAMIGWGWVVLAGKWATDGGLLGSTLAFALGGLMCAAVSLVYAELTSAFPVAGGSAIFAMEGLGSLGRSIAGWAMTAAYVSVAAWESVAISSAITYVVPVPRSVYLWTLAGAEVYLGPCLVGLAFCIGLTAINYLGSRAFSVVQNWGTALLVSVWGIFVITSVFRGDPSNFTPLWAPWDGWSGVLMMVPFMMVGFDVVPQASEEAKIPHREVGRILVVSVMAAVLWYISIILALGYLSPPSLREESSLPLCHAMEQAWNSRLAGSALAFGGICGILTSWNAFFVAGARGLMAMSRTGILTPPFSKLHPRHHTPSAAVLAVGLICAIAPFLGAGALTWFVNVGSLATCVTYLAGSISFVRLRFIRPNLPRPFRAGKGIGVGVAACVVTSFFMWVYLPVGPSSLKWPYEWLLVLAWIAVGAVGYKYSRSLPS